MKLFSTCLLYLLFMGFGGFHHVSHVQAQSLDWTFENVITDVQQSGANPDVVQDRNGNLHVSYWHNLKDRLVYARRDALSGTWTYEDLDEGTNFHGYKSAIALDANEKVHIVYVKREQNNAQIRYTTNQSGTWEVEIPNPNEHIGIYGKDLQFPIYAQTSLDIFFQADGNPAILFFDGKVNSLGLCGPIISETYLDYELDMKTWIRLGDSSWELGTFEDITSKDGIGCLLDGERFGEFCQMFTRSDNSYIAIGNSLHNHEILVFSSPDLVNWNHYSVDSTRRFLPSITETHFREGFEYLDASMVGDSSLHMIYGVSNHYGNGNTVLPRLGIYYGRVDLDSLDVPGYTGYQVQIGLTFGEYRSFSSIVNHSEDSIYACYYELNNKLLVLVKSFDRGRTWEHENISTTPTNAPVHLMIHDDRLQVLSYDSRDNQILLFSRDISGTEWTEEKGTTSERRGDFLSSVVRRTGNTDQKHISFVESVSGSLQYGIEDNANWVFEEVPLGPEVQIEALAMDLNATQEPLIIYTDDTAEQLWLASKQGTWSTRLLASFTKARNLKFIFDQGTYYISYFDLNTGHLHYLTSTALTGPWNPIVIDNTSNIVGRGLDMTLDTGGTLHLSYQDVITPKVKYASLSPGGTWQLEDITPAFNFNPNFTSIAVNSTNLVSIAFKDATSNTIQLAENDGTGWDINQIDGATGNLVGNPMELLIDDKDRPWVLFNISDIKEEIGLVRRDASNQWQAVSVTNNSAEIASVFDFHLVGEDFYIIGKKNQISNNGIGLLFAERGIRTSVEELISRTRFNMYPNPAQDVLHLEVENPEHQAVEISLYNLNGQQMHSLYETSLLPAGDQTIQLDLPDIKPGLYILLWKTETYNIPQKLFIMP